MGKGMEDSTKNSAGNSTESWKKAKGTTRIKTKKKCVLITGGGTGGHIYPALALAQAIKVLHPHVSVEMVGSKWGLEKAIFPKYPFPFHLLRMGKWNQGPSGSGNLWKRWGLKGLTLGLLFFCGTKVSLAFI